ncbi:hypothetical protein [Flavivirga eckloniae]|uniref:hypothetical protein n=1 Tax=Flavivirga eckloniae TaxID=1803846 RepID=UPI0013152B49|nr:hypothetical protein [Flavivirga eckloniae]
MKKDLLLISLSLLLNNSKTQIGKNIETIGGKTNLLHTCNVQVLKKQKLSYQQIRN